MKKLTMIMFLLVLSFDMAAQQKIRFDYDAAGNQIKREWCFSCQARTSDPTKEIKGIEDSDLSKFFPEDEISYYPNPVKEELFLKWELINNAAISEISVFNVNGSLLKKFEDLESTTSHSIPFSEYPKGIYFIELKYSTGEVKSIKIIK